MKLLIIKSGTRYFKINADEFCRVGLDKASVFPMDRLDHVKELEKTAITRGYKEVRIKKLVLSEEDL